MEEKKLEDIYFFRSGKTINKVILADVDYILAYGNFCKFFTKREFVVVPLTLSKAEDKFVDKGFVRIHRSCIVPLQKIEKIIDNVVYIDMACLPIGKLYRENFYKKILET
jgi:DNA-binding LytR/AlgR family response regulator